MLMFNKICLSFYGSKVRQHFSNPAFAKTAEKMQKALNDVFEKDMSGRFDKIAHAKPADRAAALVASGKPGLD